jgi:2-polyprenyl-3-methyl-5-hydroxy-6-metoxy-1,4-benzoquinol methylase
MNSRVTPIAQAETYCPCGSPTAVHEVFRTETRRYLECPRCGLVFLAPRPAAEAVRAFYSEQYDDAYGRAEAQSDRGSVFRSVLRHVERFKLPPGRLLDIGCGDGEFLALCLPRGWACFGVEISREAVQRAAARGVTMLAPHWLDGPAGTEDGDKPYDVITLINVLETVHDPCLVLRRVHAALAPDGVVVIRVSNGDFHLAARRPVQWVGGRYQQAFHQFVFTPRSLRWLLRAAGLTPVSIGNSRPSRSPVYGSDHAMKRWGWRLGGSTLWGIAQTLYRLSGNRIVLAPSFEVVAVRSSKFV